MDHLPETSDSKTMAPIHVPCLVDPNEIATAPNAYDEYLAVKESEITRIAGVIPPGERVPFYDTFKGPTKESMDLGDLKELLRKTQLLMFFGLLRTAFGVAKSPVDGRRFVSIDGRNQPVITTKELPVHIEDVFIVAEQLDAGTKLQMREKIFLLIANTYWWLDIWESRLQYLYSPSETGKHLKIMRDYGSHHSRSPKAQMIILSIRILGETLAQMSHAAYSDHEIVWNPAAHVRFDERHFPSGFEQQNSEFVDNLMVEAGWCPNEAARFTHRYNQNSMTLKYFASQMNRHKLAKDHTRCTRHKCVQRIFYPYLPQHMPPKTCTCSHVYSTADESESLPDSQDLGKVVRFINSECIPLLTIPNASSAMDPLKLDISSYNPSIKAPCYVAVSHVWADGLGNRDSNWLPRCVVQVLQALCNQAGDTDTTNIPFWIDTLCIPRKDRSARKKAILLMKQVYKNARHVLVLDKGLMRTKFTSATWEELLMAIANSSWMQRLWTLQEARLAQELVFVFMDHVLRIKSIEDLLKILDKSYNRVTTEILQKNNRNTKVDARLAEHWKGGHIVGPCIDRIAGALPKKTKPNQVNARFTEYWKTGHIFGPFIDRTVRALSKRRDTKGNSKANDPLLSLILDICARSTSEPRDEALCLALLLNKNVDEILNIQNDDLRISVLLSSMEKVPAILCFFQGPRYQDERKRWIPYSFLVHNGRLGPLFGSISGDFNSTFNFVEGLHYGSPTEDGLQVKLPGFLLHTKYWSQKISETYFPSEIFFKTCAANYRLILTEGDTLRVREVDRSIFTRHGVAIMLPPGSEDQYTEKDFASVAILVSVLRSTNNTLRVQFESNAIVHRAEYEAYSNKLSFPILWRGDDQDIFDYLPARLLPQTQKWCLG